MPTKRTSKKPATKKTTASKAKTGSGASKKATRKKSTSSVGKAKKAVGKVITGAGETLSSVVEAVVPSPKGKKKSK